MLVRVGDLTDPKVQSLLRYHFEDLQSKGPAETSFVMSLAAMQNSSLTLFTAWDGNELVGCGALKELDGTHGEIKSMRTAPERLQKGVGKCIAQHIIEEAKRRRYSRLSLETGTRQEFVGAQQLYKRLGFERCDPFGDYVAHENNMFMTMHLRAYM